MILNSRLSRCLNMWVLFWRRAPEIPHLIAFTWVCCYGNGGGRGLSVPLVSGSAAAVRSSVTSSLESAPPSHFTTQLLETRCASAPLPSPRSEPDRSCLLQCVFLWNQARLDLSRDSHLSCVCFFSFSRSQIVRYFQGKRRNTSEDCVVNMARIWQEPSDTEDYLCN